MLLSQSLHENDDIKTILPNQTNQKIMREQINESMNHDTNNSTRNFNIHDDLDLIKLDNMKIIQTIKLLTIRKKIFKIILLIILFFWLVLLTNGFAVRAQSNPKNINNLIFFLESIEINPSLHVAYCQSVDCLNHPNTEQALIAMQYCDLSSCGSGCLRRWPDQSTYTPTGAGFIAPEYVNGRNFGQDDSEKPCFIPNGLNGHPSIKGGPPYGKFTHDKYLELQVPDIMTLSQDFSIFLLCKPIDQTTTGDWSYFGQATSLLNHKVSNNSLNLRISGATSTVQLSTSNSVKLNQWQLIEVHRDALDNLSCFINSQNVTNGNISRSGSMRIGYLFSNFKSEGDVAMYGEIAAFIVYDRALNSTEKDDVRNYLNNIYDYKTLTIEEFNASTLKISPNPTTDKIIVENNSGLKLDTLTIYDLNGRELMLVDLNLNPKFDIDISNLESAAYIITIQSGNNKVSKLFLKK